jgi:hypothetical protein
MFEKEIKFISDFSLNKIKKLGSFFTFERLLNSDLHPAIAQYISAELDFLIYEDRRKLLQDSVFDYSSPEISKYFALIGSEIKKTKKVSFQDIKKLIVQAVSFNVNYVVRPRWSLSKLIFNGATSKPVEELKLVLNYVFYYDYLKNVLLTYLTKKNIRLITPVEFDVIMNKIDKALFTSAPEQLIDNALYSMADFFNLGGINKTFVTGYLIESFLKEKNLLDYLFKLRRAVPADSKQKYEINDLRKVLYSTQPIEPIIGQPGEPDVELKKSAYDKLHEPEREEKQSLIRSPEEAQSIKKEVKDEVKQLEKTPQPDIERESYSKVEPQPAINLSESDEDLLKKLDAELKALTEEMPELSDEIDFVSEDNLEVDDTIETEETDLDEITVDENYTQPGDENIDLNIEEELDFEQFELNIDEKEEIIDDKKQIADEEPKEISKADTAQKPEQVPSIGKRKDYDIFTFLSNKEIEKIVESVFNDDREDFVNTLEKIMECTNYDEATEILKGVFLTYRINPYSKEAVTLTNAVSHYFEQS